MVKERLSYKTIAHPPDRFDIFIFGVELFQLGTDIAHVDFDSVIVAEVILAPDAFKQIRF